MWPIYKWSYNEKYFARLNIDSILLYTTKTFEEKILKIDNISDFSFCPNKSIISYWIPENDTTPAKVALIEIPTKKELCSKSFYGAYDISTMWCKSGNFVAFRFNSVKKKKIRNNIRNNIN